jgi:hypothetical protein
MSSNDYSPHKKPESNNNSPKKNLLNILKEAQNHHISLKENNNNPFLEIYDSEREEFPVNLPETDEKIHIKDFIYPKKNPQMQENSLCTFDPLYRSQSDCKKFEEENLPDTRTADFSEGQKYRIPLNLWIHEIKRRLIDSIAYIDNIIFTIEDSIHKNENEEHSDSQELYFFNKVKLLNKNLVNILEDFKRENKSLAIYNDSVYTTKVHQMKSSIADLTKLHIQINEKDNFNFPSSSDNYKSSTNNSNSHSTMGNFQRSQKENLDMNSSSYNEISYLKNKLLNKGEEILGLNKKINNLENLLNLSGELVDEIYNKNRLLQNKLIKYKSIADQYNQFTLSKGFPNSKHSIRY